MDGPVPYERQYPGFKLEWLMGNESPLGFDLAALFCSGKPGGRLLTPKSARCSDFESSFQVNDERQTFSSGNIRLENVMTILIEEKTSTQHFSTNRPEL